MARHRHAAALADGVFGTLIGLATLVEANLWRNETLAASIGAFRTH
jgi:hypothetical protein